MPKIKNELKIQSLFTYLLSKHFKNLKKHFTYAYIVVHFRNKKICKRKCFGI